MKYLLINPGLEEAVDSSGVILFDGSAISVDGLGSYYSVSSIMFLSEGGDT